MNNEQSNAGLNQKMELALLLSKLATEIAHAENFIDMYGPDWSADNFVREAHDLTEKLMNQVSELPDLSDHPKRKADWYVPGDCSSIVCAGFGNVMYEVGLRMDEYPEGFEPFLVVVTPGFGEMIFQKFYTYEGAIQFIRDDINQRDSQEKK